jgi:hypothetical protein
MFPYRHGGKCGIEGLPEWLCRVRQHVFVIIRPEVTADIAGRRDIERIVIINKDSATDALEPTLVGKPISPKPNLAFG